MKQNKLLDHILDVDSTEKKSVLKEINMMQRLHPNLKVYKDDILTVV